MLKIFVWMLSWLAAPGFAQAACADLDVAGLKRLAATRQVTPVVFCASWCGECVVHLRQTPAPGTVLIATFDTREAAEHVIKHFGVTMPCYLDRGIAAAYAVKSVPVTLRLDHDAAVLK